MQHIENEQQLEQRVAERTAELSYINDRLAEEIRERIRIEQQLAEQKESLHRQIEEQTADLRRVNEYLLQAAHQRDAFLASMSHELRTPLNGILGMSESLIEETYGTLNERQQTSVSRIGESGRHLLTMINDILDLAKIGSGKLSLVMGKVGVSSFIEHTLHAVRHQITERRLSLTTTVDPTVEFLYADERRLQQMVTNLLNNAIKFTPEGGDIGIEVSGSREHQVVRFTVWDTGIGIPRERIPFLFQPFVQVDSKLSRQYSGAGLGLAMVSRLAELHNGSISVESEEGKGSRFVLALPWQQRMLEDFCSHMECACAVCDQSCALHPFRHLDGVLVVDDSLTATELISRYLGEIGIETNVCSCGKDALRMASEMRPDLIILDLILPDMSGWAILEVLQNTPNLRDIPVLITSVLEKPFDHIEGVEYLVKPISRYDLFTAINMLLKCKHALRRSLPNGALPPSPPPTILLAEDNHNTIRMTSDFLNAKGYRVKTARNGIEAVALARSGHPDLIIMDIQMPELSGEEAIPLIRQDSALINTPIVALTALAMPGDRERCLAAGATEYLSKPVRLKELLGVIESLIKTDTYVDPHIEGGYQCNPKSLSLMMNQRGERP
jgi:signal transduction histidine kinase/CheY-like chemotaxis protein